MAIRSKFLRATLLTVALSGFSTAASAAIVYDTTGGAENGGDPVSAVTGAGPILADRFFNPTAGTLGSVALELSSASAPDAGDFLVELFADRGEAGPGAATLIATVSDASLTSNFQLLSFAPLSPVELAAGTTYYVGIADDNASSAVLGNTLDPAVLARPEVVSGAFYFNNGGLQDNSGGPYEVVVDVSAAPEPSTWALMIAGVGVVGGALGSGRRRNCLRGRAQA